MSECSWREIGFLKERWVELHREMFDFDNTNEQERNDVEAEIEFRRDELPFEMITEEFDAFSKKLNDEMERMEKEEPDRFDDMERDISVEVAAFLRQLKKSSN